MGIAALLVLAAQLYLGGWTSTNYAALACPDFPTCQQRWLPDTDFGEAFRFWRGLGVNYEYGVLDLRARATIHYTHRLGALVTTVVLGLLALALWRERLRGHAAALLGAIVLQLAIGIAMVLDGLPLWLATAHNAGAALLLLALVASLHRVLSAPVRT